MPFTRCWKTNFGASHLMSSSPKASARSAPLALKRLKLRWPPGAAAQSHSYLSIASTLTDVYDDIMRVAEVLGVSQAGDDLVTAMTNRAMAVADLAKEIDVSPRVACIEWSEPLMAAGQLDSGNGLISRGKKPPLARSVGMRRSYPGRNSWKPIPKSSSSCPVVSI